MVRYGHLLIFNDVLFGGDVTTKIKKSGIKLQRVSALGTVWTITNVTDMTKHGFLR